MVFSSVAFLFYFLPIFLAAYYAFGLRNGVIISGSAVFYTWGEGAYLFLLAGLIVANYYIGLWIEAAQGKLLPITLGVTVDIAVLAAFKYTTFVVWNVAALFGVTTEPIHIPLPLGISFFTFQLISYLIDVRRGEIPAERDITRLGTYIAMFPHLIAGPIVRYADIDRELFARSIDLNKICLGVQFLIVGLCQKILIANTVAPAADTAFALPASELTAAAAWTGALAYTLQIYFDFCGYSNMAIGLAFLLGFRFPKNFDYPYSAHSLTEFWRRWHMSLSFWFRDYVYIPLGGSRGGRLQTLRNLIIVFFLTGLWHGASWTFVVWGLFHGAFLIAERVGLARLLARAPAPLAWAYTMLVVIVGWIFFRASGFPEATTYLVSMAGFGSSNALVAPIPLWVTPEVAAAILVGSLFSFPILPRLLERIGVQSLVGPVVPGTHQLEVTPVHPIPVSALAAGLALSLVLLISSSLNPFLYFRF